MKGNKLLIVLCTILVIFIGIIVFLLFSIKDKETFKKPKFDKNVSEIPEKLDYEKSVLNILSGYSVYISPSPVVLENDYLKVDMISLEDNTIFIKLRILDEKDNIIGETGILRPGDYLEKVKVNKKLKKNDQIKYKIMGYEKDSYMSAGSVTLNTRVGE